MVKFMNKFLNKAVLFHFWILLYVSSFSQTYYDVNLNDIADDHFKVTVLPQNLTDKSTKFIFAASAPGTYQKMNIGRFVRNFFVYDAAGKEIKSERISTNVWNISEPKRVAKIVYDIAETWDTPVKEDPIYLMCGSSLEKDHALISPHTVFGFFPDKQKEKYFIKFDMPSDWKKGTPLQKNNLGYYTADSYDHLVDSPFLFGRLSDASVTIDNTLINIYTYSVTDKITSNDLLIHIKDVLIASRDFMHTLPVDNYTFLFHFEKTSMGAWEHSYSSQYVYAEKDLNDEFIHSIVSTVAHEFYHVITPLNLHSELVGSFDFENPVMSQHLWLYEGTTEWASNALMLRGGLISVEDYLKDVRQKIFISEYFDPSVSLTELSVNSFAMQDQYFNIYNKGALTAGLLDILILDKSNGKISYRDVINHLKNEFGANVSFSENGFFEYFVSKTFPEVEDFINKYIKGFEPLPFEEYYDKIGINYYARKGYDSSKSTIGLQFGFDGKSLFISYEDERTQQLGLKAGDVLIEADGKKLKLENIEMVFRYILSLPVGTIVQFKFANSTGEFDVNIDLIPEPRLHIFEINENPSERQKLLFNAWKVNK